MGDNGAANRITVHQFYKSFVGGVPGQKRIVVFTLGRSWFRWIDQDSKWAEPGSVYSHSSHLYELVNPHKATIGVSGLRRPPIEPMDYQLIRQRLCLKHREYSIGYRGWFVR
jgi:hypothetical protein